MKKQNKGKLSIITAMVSFGSIGLFVRMIDLSSGQIALARALAASLFLAAVLLYKRYFKKRQRLLSKGSVSDLIWLVISGGAIGFNWIFLFEAYRYTSIAAATLSYYLAPLFVVLLSPLVLKEPLKPLKLLFVAVAVCGLGLIIAGENRVPGTFSESLPSDYRGFLFGLAAAVLYASVVLINKAKTRVSGLETTAIQLISGFFVLLPYILLSDGLSGFVGLAPQGWIYLLILGIIHTGIAYYLYFTGSRMVSGQQVAMLSYIDPVFAIIFAAVFLKEIPGFVQIGGGIMILAAAYLSEIYTSKTSPGGADYVSRSHHTKSAQITKASSNEILPAKEKEL